MTIAWTTERVVRWDGGGESEEIAIRCARHHRLRVLSDPQRGKLGDQIPRADFEVAIDAELMPWLRALGTADPYEHRASGQGVDLEIVEDITLGVRHETKVHVKPSDPTIARWTCSCGTSSRGVLSPDFATEAAEAHRSFATDAVRRPTDLAVAQDDTGQWAQRQILVARRLRLCARSDFSTIVAHRKGSGEDFELVVDAGLGLWLRRLSTDNLLRHDESASGVSVMVFNLV